MRNGGSESIYVTYSMTTACQKSHDVSTIQNQSTDNLFDRIQLLYMLMSFKLTA